MDKMKSRFEVPLPYISNESSDPFMSGRLQYSFSKGGTTFFGSDAKALAKYAQEMEVEELDAGGILKNTIYPS